MTARRSRTLRGLTAAAVGLLIASAVLAFIGWQRLFREIPQQLADDSMEEYFKYGSIGTEDAEGLPYYIWMVLSRLFPEYLPQDSRGVHRPGGYAAFGMAWEQGRETPVGFSRKTIGFPRVGINCALCHSTTWRAARDEVPPLVTGGPAQRFNALAYLNFLASCGPDPRFTADQLLKEIDYSVRLDPIDRLLYRWVIIPRTRKALIQQSARYAWTRHHNRPEWGPGRIDPFNTVKFHQLALPDDGTIGNSDMMPIWNLQSRKGQTLYWDGLNSDLTEVVLTGAIGDGATNDSLPVN